MEVVSGKTMLTNESTGGRASFGLVSWHSRRCSILASMERKDFGIYHVPFYWTESDETRYFPDAKQTPPVGASPTDLSLPPWWVGGHRVGAHPLGVCPKSRREKSVWKDRWAWQARGKPVWLRPAADGQLCRACAGRRSMQAKDSCQVDRLRDKRRPKACVQFHPG